MAGTPYALDPLCIFPLHLLPSKDGVLNRSITTTTTVRDSCLHWVSRICLTNHFFNACQWEKSLEARKAAKTLYKNNKNYKNLPPQTKKNEPPHQNSPLPSSSFASRWFQVSAPRWARCSRWTRTSYRTWGSPLSSSAKPRALTGSKFGTCL